MVAASLAIAYNLGIVTGYGMWATISKPPCVVIRKVRPRRASQMCGYLGNFDQRTVPQVDKACRRRIHVCALHGEDHC